MLYCSQTLALAALEVLVHLSGAHKRVHFLALELTLPDGAPTTSWNADELPEGWRTLEGNAQLRARGSAWARSGHALALSVPSVVIPSERNILLNAAHPMFGQVRVTREEPFHFDGRLWK